MEVTVAGERLRLLPQRAALHVDTASLLVADCHLGKADTFRRRGVPVPVGTTDETLTRLAACVAATRARRVIFLGDLLHAREAQTGAIVGAFGRWRRAHADLELLLVRGNHDLQAGDPPADWGVAACSAPLALGRLRLCHEPETDAEAAGDGYVIAGHVHPCAWVGGRGHDRLRLPCFHFGERAGVLPAFGAFTGMHALPRDPADRVVVVADDALVELPRRRA